jgi:hypothetical protein
MIGGNEAKSVENKGISHDGGPKKEWVGTQKRMGTYPIKYGYLPKKEWVGTLKRMGTYPIKYG